MCLYQVEQFKQDPSPTKCLHSVFNVVTGDEISSYSDYHHLQVSQPADRQALQFINWLFIEIRKSGNGIFVCLFVCLLSQIGIVIKSYFIYISFFCII